MTGHRSMTTTSMALLIAALVSTERLILRCSTKVQAFQPLWVRTEGGRHHRARLSSWPAIRARRRHFAVSRRVAIEATNESAVASSASSQPVPMTLLSGFLGTGKTSCLKHLLETNNNNKKIGVIVNDVASVNIDSKLVASSTNNMVELQNGCACCSLADELFMSVDQLLEGGRVLDAIVVELSGVADPMAIQSNWNMAPVAVRQQANIANVVTLVDAQTFGTDYLTWDMAGERAHWVDPGDDCGAQRKVSELLAEQVEAAQLVLVNKVDLATSEQVQVASAVVRALNDKALVVPVKFGQVDASLILQAANDHPCDDPTCTDSSHDHSHHDDDHHTAAAATAIHSEHDHSPNHEHDADCHDPHCTDSSHSHSHEHGDDAAAGDCQDPNCTDASHLHSHSHSHSHATSTDQLGIDNFVYRASVPFDGTRLMNLLSVWPVPVKDTLDLGVLQEAAASTEGYVIDGKSVSVPSPFAGVLRSKGFCWFAPSKWTGADTDAWRHETAMYWSHAGRHFSITSAGKWWGTLSRDRMKKVLGANLAEYERILREDFVSDEFGDRRQEIVFIGMGLDEDAIRAKLDECLLTEPEMKTLRQRLSNYMNTILDAQPRGGLFDVGAVDHVDSSR